MASSKNGFSATCGLMIICILLMRCGSVPTDQSTTTIRISVVNSPSDIVTTGANFLAHEIRTKTRDRIDTKVFHSGVLSGGKGETEIEMCQQGAIQMHITSTAYLANLVPKTSIVSLPFLFRDMTQVAGLLQSKSAVLDSINRELQDKGIHIIAWWPRGFRQLTNSKLPVESMKDLRGLKLRVMNNPLYADNMRAMNANPVPMAWGEVYNGLQLKTIDGQENAEDVIYSSRLFEAQTYMTIWDYSIDLEVVLVNFNWWRKLRADDRTIIQEAADRSVAFEDSLLARNTVELRKKIADEGMKLSYLKPGEKERFREAVEPVWDKYEKIFGKPFLEALLSEMENY